jgi:hypothetical protein
VVIARSPARVDPPPDEDRATTASIWRTAVLAYVVGRLAVLAGALAVTLAHAGTTLRDALTVWDAEFYERMATSGYPHHIIGPDGRAVGSTIVFPPAYGMLGRVADRVLPGGAPAALLVISLVAGLAATGLVGMLLARHCDAATARRGVVLFAVFPGSFVFGFAYSEGLAIAFAAACLLLMEDERWLAAGAVASLAVLARSPGIAIVVPAAIVAVHQVRRRDVKALIVPGGAIAAYVGFHLFLWHHTGQWDAWFRVEHEGWGQRLDLYEGMLRPVKAALTVSDLPYVQLAGWGVLAGAAGIALLLKDRAPVALWSYAAATLALSLTGSLISARPRALLTAFPLVLPLARRVGGPTFAALVVASTLGLAVLTYHYGIGFQPGARSARSMVP